MERTSQRRIPLVLIAIAVVLLALRIAAHFLSTADEAKPLVNWVSIAEGIELARTSDKPILFDFMAEWCQPCHVLDAEVFQNAAIAREINERFIAVRVVDRRQEDGRNHPSVDALQRRYNVRAFPTLVIADAAGEERARMEGFRGRVAFERMMAQALR